MKAWKSYLLIVIVAVSLALNIAYGENVGELDTTFGEDGKVITSFGEFGDKAYAVALQPDGKILAAGSASNGYDLDIAIARYNEDGSLDSSFGNEGKVRTSLGEGDEEINAIGVQDDGYIVVAGYTVINGAKSFVLVRFTPDGEFDNSFGEGGIVVTQFGNEDDEITAMAIDDEGRIVVSGYVTGTVGYVVAVARYLESGAPDTTFGDEGVSLIDLGDDALARSIDIDDEGRIVTTGSYFHAERTELMILRFFEDGDLDTAFGQEGIAVPASGEEASEGFGIGLVNDGLIIVAGSVGTKGDLDSAIFRFTDAGQPDSSFGDNGVLITSSSDEDDMALAIDVLDNVVGLSGYSTFNTKRDFLFVSVEETVDEETDAALNLETGSFNFSSAAKRYNGVFDLNGQRSDSSEGETTEKSVFNTTPFGYTDDVSFAVVLQPDGKAVSAGFTEQDGISSFAIARYVTPVANAAGGGVDNSVGWIMTKEPTEVNRTGAFTGGTIIPSGLTIKQRGVVYSIAPDPVYEEAGEETNPDDPADPDNPVDTIPPVISGNDTVIVSDTEVTVTTNENATCKYTETDPGMDYNNMKLEFDTTGGTTHTEPVSGLTVGDKFYIRCQDASGNSNTSSFEVTVAASAKIANRLSSPATNVTNNIVNASVDLSGADAILQAEDTSYAGTDEIELIISNGSPFGEIAAGSSMTYIGAYTNEQALCKYSDLPGLDFASMVEAMATADNLSHIAKVDGLQDDNSYSFFVKCRDFAGNENVAEYEISFRVAASDSRYQQTYRQMTKTLRDYILPNAHAQATTTGTVQNTTNTSTTASTSAFDLTSPEYLLEGHTDDGGGSGSYSSILKNLKPGTFYYVRAYAIDSNNKVYYGNQVGLKTADSCFIATAAYGTLLHPYVKVLRNFRDQYMITNVVGRNLVNMYYYYSPPFADYISQRPVVRGAARIALLPVIGMGWLVLNIGFTGLALMVVLLFIPSVMIYRSYRRLEVQ